MSIDNHKDGSEEHEPHPKTEEISKERYHEIRQKAAEIGNKTEFSLFSNKDESMPTAPRIEIGVGTEIVDEPVYDEAGNIVAYNFEVEKEVPIVATTLTYEGDIYTFRFNPTGESSFPQLLGGTQHLSPPDSTIEINGIVQNYCGQPAMLDTPTSLWMIGMLTTFAPNSPAGRIWRQNS